MAHSNSESISQIFIKPRPKRKDIPINILTYSYDSDADEDSDFELENEIEEDSFDISSDGFEDFETVDSETNSSYMDLSTDDITGSYTARDGTKWHDIRPQSDIPHVATQNFEPHAKDLSKDAKSVAGT